MNEKKFNQARNASMAYHFGGGSLEDAISASAAYHFGEARKPRQPRSEEVSEDYGYPHPVCHHCGVNCVDNGVMATEDGNVRDWECPQCGVSVWVEE